MEVEVEVEMEMDVEVDVNMKVNSYSETREFGSKENKREGGAGEGGAKCFP